MLDFTALEVFEWIKGLLSFVDSICGVGCAIAVTVVFMRRGRRRDRAISSEQIHNLSSELGEIGNDVKRLEVEKELLEEKLMQTSGLNTAVATPSILAT